MEKISIYQVFTRLFGNNNSCLVENGSQLQNGVGKMNDFSEKALKSIKQLGITHIWYTGIIEHASCEGYSEYNIPAQHPAVVKGRAGSPYAITDYYDINPYLAENIPNRMREFDDLVYRTHKAGLSVIIDFVPNHVARQYHSDVFPERDFGKNDNTSQAFSPTNDFYYIPNESLHLDDNMGTFYAGRTHEPYFEFPAKATGNDQFHAHPSINDWYETVKLNYGIDYVAGHTKYFDPMPPLWDKMVAILEFWCAKKIDGIRCDMAEMVPVEFWKYAIAKVKSKYPDVIFIAEVYNPNEYHNYLKAAKFDYLYDKVGLYDCLRNIICHGAPAYEITKTWQNLGGIDAKMLRFLENHDEQRIASEQFAGNPIYALPAMLISATLNKGPIMTYFGQEVGEPAKGASGYSGDDGRTTIFDFYNVPEHQKWFNKGQFNEQLLSDEQISLRKAYTDLLNFCINNKAITIGYFYDLMWVNNFNGGPDTRYIYAYLRHFKNEKLLIIVNFHKTDAQQFKLKIPIDALHIMGCDEIAEFNFTEVFSENKIVGQSLEQLTQNGMEIKLLPFQSCIFAIN